jgi:hypothetical protein
MPRTSAPFRRQRCPVSRDFGRKAPGCGAPVPAVDILKNGFKDE